jgi:hypothetical protein
MTTAVWSHSELRERSSRSSVRSTRSKCCWIVGWAVRTVVSCAPVQVNVRGGEKRKRRGSLCTEGEVEDRKEELKQEGHGDDLGEESLVRGVAMR